MPDVSLDDYFATAETKFGNHRITVGDKVVTMQNSLTLDKETRRQLNTAQKRLNNLQSDDEDVQATELQGDEDQTDGMLRVLGEVITLVSDDKAAARDMLERIGSNLPVLLEIFQDWNKKAQPGEAEPSGT